MARDGLTARAGVELGHGRYDDLGPFGQLELAFARFKAWFEGLDALPRSVFALSAISAFLFATWLCCPPHLRRDVMGRRILAATAVILTVFVLVHSQSSTLSAPGSMMTLSVDSDVGQNVIPNIKDPLAVDPQDVCPGYKAINVVTSSSGLTADLHLAGKPCNVYGNEIEALTLTVEYQAADRLHVGIAPKYIGKGNSTWFLLSEEILAKPKLEDPFASSKTDLEFSWSNRPSFSFEVKRKSSGDVLFTTEGTSIVYEDQFIEFKSSLPKNYNLYGLGEVIHSFRLGNNLTRTLFAADVGDVVDADIYGHHPIYYDTRYFEDRGAGHLEYVPEATDKKAMYKSYTHAVFNRNAHTQEVLLRPSGVTWRALGGTIDLYFYQGPTQDAATKAYQTSAIGLPAMQQYWTFGFHQCRWGYKSWKEIRGVVDNFKKFEIPLETMWTDIDYMHAYRDFTNDKKSWGYDEGAKFIQRLHDANQHYVPIIDSAIYAPNPDKPEDAYPVYDRGLEQDAFMLNPDGSLYIGAVWPGYTVFPDWVGALLEGTGANRWWINETAQYYEKIKFDGIWIDMSEVASFCVGSCGSPELLKSNPIHPPFQLPGEPGNEVFDYPEGFERTNATEAASASAAAASQSAATAKPSATVAKESFLRTKPTPGARNVNWPPYTINHINGDIAVHAVSPNATHHGGALEYDFHNVFGHQILNATYHALLEIFPGKRPFVIGRSQFAGSSKWAGHWGGDNYSLWSYLFFSIPQALSYSLFGFPMFGVDTCGFAGNADMELCSRWMQLSAFFPFYRNHNAIGSISQEPFVWSHVAEASKRAMRIRYSLLPYMYTTFFLSHSTGSTTMRALSWDFPDEPWLAAADRQFLLGDAILVTPCLEQGATTVKGVFPGVGSGTVWYDWYNQTAVKGVSRGQNVTIDAPLGHIPVYLKGGNVVPLQEPALTTAEVRNSSWSLLVALGTDGLATGGLYLDDGESLVPEATTWVGLAATPYSLTATPSGTFVDTNALANVTVMGVAGAVSTVRLNGRDVVGGGGSGAAAAAAWTLDVGDGGDGGGGVLRITGLDELTRGGAWDSAWTLTWA